MKNFFALIVLVAVIVVGLLAGGIGVAAYNSTPEAVTKNVVSNAVENLASREELEPVKQVLTGGSVEIRAADLKVDDEATFKFEAGAKLYFSPDAFYLQNLNVKGYGVDLSADAYISEDLIYVKENDILGGAYGILKKELAKELENSIFAPDANTDYALNETTFEELMTFCESLKDTKAKDMQKDLEKLLDRYMKEFWKIALDAVEMDSEKKEVKVGGERITAKVVTIEINDAAVAEIIEKMYDYLSDDKKLIDFVEKYEDSLTPMLAQYAMLDEDESLADFIKDSIDEAADSVDLTVEALEDSDNIDIKIEIVTDTFGSKLMMLTVRVDKVKMFELDCGAAGLEKSDEITVSVMGNEVLSYTIKENSKEAFKASLKYEGEEIFNLAFDKKRETFKINLLDGEIIAKGTLTEKGDKTTFTLKSIEADGEYITGTLTVIIDENDKMPSPEKAKNVNQISDITVEDIQKWLEKLEELYEKAEDNFYKAMEEQNVGF